MSSSSLRNRSEGARSSSRLRARARQASSSSLASVGLELGRASRTCPSAGSCSTLATGVRRGQSPRRSGLPPTSAQPYRACLDAELTADSRAQLTLDRRRAPTGLEQSAYLGPRLALLMIPASPAGINRIHGNVSRRRPLFVSVCARALWSDVSRSDPSRRRSTTAAAR